MSKNPQAVLDVLEFYTENMKSNPTFTPVPESSMGSNSPIGSSSASAPGSTMTSNTIGSVTSEFKVCFFLNFERILISNFK